jgi:predicted MFS family arabinose efflux permease
MSQRALKPGYFILEGLNSFATVYYFYYLYFFMRQRFGFGDAANLRVAALSGGVYALLAWWTGRFAQKFGYFTALKIGFATMILSLSLGFQADSAVGHLLVMTGTVIGMSFTWPTLEALISEGEAPGGLQKMVGIYNMVWAGSAALANFTGGAMLEKLGFKSLFYGPIAIQISQLGLTLWLERQAFSSSCSASFPFFLSRRSRPNRFGVRQSSGALSGSASEGAAVLTEEPMIAAIPHPLELPAPPTAKAKNFLRMAWLANPFAYIAINTIIAVIPGVAHRLKLSTMVAGFCCSLWCFARFGAFVGLWFWEGWHYRFRWLLGSFAALTASFALVLIAPNLWVLMLAQVVFGGAVGLIYSSSLFYSMDLSSAKGEHGGIHEAVIGVGNFAGPALGAASMYLLPTHPYSGALAVTTLLVFGLAALVGVWRIRA